MGFCSYQMLLNGRQKYVLCADPSIVNIHRNITKAGDQQNNFCTVMPQRFETPLNQKRSKINNLLD